MSTKRKALATFIVVFLLAGFSVFFIKTYSLSNVVKLQDRQNEKQLENLREDWQSERNPKLEGIEQLKFILEKQEKELQRLDESWERKINHQKLNFSLSYIEEIEQDCREGSPSCEERKKNIPPETSIIPHAEAADLVPEVGNMVEQKVEAIEAPKESVVVSTKKAWVLIGGNERQKKTSLLADEVSGNDLNFLALLVAENEAMTPDRLSPFNPDGKTRDHGFCQINDYWHKKVVYDPKFLTDEKWQMEQCYRLFKGGTKFYGLPRSKQHIANGRFEQIDI